MSNGKMDRRDFLKVMGVSGVAASVAGCDMPSFITSEQGAEQVVPYLSPEEYVIPGKGVWYASTCLQCPSGCGVRGRVREGRVLKLEGNPESAINAGKLCQMGQAGLQNHYNPDRLTTPMVRDGGALKPATWAQALALIEEKTGPNSGISGDRFGWLTGTVSGHQAVLLKAHLEAMGSSNHFVHELINTQVWQAACRDMLGQAMPNIRIDKAQLVLSFGADFLGTWMSPMQLSGQYAQFRSTPDRGMLIQAEPSMTLTGANADLWVAVRPGTEGILALGIANMLINKEKMDASALPPAVRAVIEQYDVSTTTRDTGVSGDRLVRIARHLKNKSPSLILAGASMAGHKEGYWSVAAAMILNVLLGNVGKTIEPAPQFPFPQLMPIEGGTADLGRLVKALETQSLDVLFHDGSNPLYGAPGYMKLSEKLDAVPFKVAFSQFMDETTAKADVVLPMASAAEDWGTHVAAYQGGATNISFQQPLMEPVFPDTRSSGDLLLSLIKMRNPGPYDELEDYYDYLQSAVATIPGAIKGDGADEVNVQMWNAILQTGVLEVPSAATGFEENITASPIDGHRDNAGYPYHLVPTPRSTLYDGRHANIPWLQEAPDQITKVVWNSWAELHPSLAAKLGIEEGDIVRITSAGGVIEAMAYIHKGIHPEVVAVPMGQGHNEYGRYAKDRGVNPLSIVDAGSDTMTGELALYGTRIKVEATGRVGRLVKTGAAETQHGRKIVATITGDHLRRTEGS